MTDVVFPSQWRFVPIHKGGKNPICLTNHPDGWAANPLIWEDAIKLLGKTVDGYSDSRKQSGKDPWYKTRVSAIGCLVGSVSGGLLLLDHDGESCTEMIQQWGELPKTWIVTSGRKGHCQYAFWVPEIFWDGIQNTQIKSTRIDENGNEYVVKDEDGKDEHIEFRWSGQQSLVYGEHPDTKKNYYWLNTDCEIAEAPIWLIEKMLKPEAGHTPEPTKAASKKRSAPDYVPMTDQEWALEYLYAIDIGSLDWYEWRNCVLAAHEAGLSESEVEQWSATSPKHTAKGFNAVWRHIKGRSFRRVSLGTLGYIAKQHGWKPKPKKHQASSASTTEAQKCSKSTPNPSDLSSTPADKEFPFLVVDQLYSDTPWICVSGRLYRWTGKGYQERPDEVELQRIQAVAESVCFFSEKLGREVYPYAKPSAVKAALEWAKIKFARDPDLCNPPGVNCTNGIRVWNDTKGEFELIPHSPEHYFLYEPVVTYDSDAYTEDCDRLLSALNPEQLQVLLKTIAASIDLKLVRKRRGRGVRAILARGIGSNGKDAHREAFSQLFGKKGCTSLSFEDFAQYDSGRKFPLAGLRTARMNWASENAGSINLDRLQSLKKTITSDPLHYELKGRDHTEFTPNVVNIFNVNDIPRLGAAQEAIRSRFAVLDYEKTYKIGADESKGEIEADPRLKYDPEFIQKNILPALLNKVEQAFKDLLADGIDYSCTDAALEEIQSYNSHLWDFVRSVGLEPDPSGTVAVSDIWASLEAWYQETGILEVSVDNFNKKTKVWAEPARAGDQFVKGANQVYKRLLELFAGLKQFDMGGNRKGIKGLKFATPKPMPEPEPIEAPDLEPVAESEPVSTTANSEAVITLDSVPEPESVTVARYTIAFKQAAQQPHGFGENKHLVQLIEELKPEPLELKRAIWRQLPDGLMRQINAILDARPDLKRLKNGGAVA
jgi:phage/plasmid-associated DNA primase